MNDYFKNYDVRWADLDVNFHMRHSAYNDYAAQVRLSFLQEKGLTLYKMRELGIGPILFSEKIDFLKEVSPGDTLKVTLQIAAMTPGGRKWKMRHEFFRGDGKKAATLEVTGAWFDTVKRSLITPSEEVQKMFLDLSKTDDFSDSL